MHENFFGNSLRESAICKSKLLKSNAADNTSIAPENKVNTLEINPQHTKAILGKSKLCNTKGVFSAQPIHKGERIIQLTGEIVQENNEHALQIDEKKFIGTSENIDDFINHCCKPNCFIKFDNDEIFLVALRDIAIGEELSFDYHTTEFDLGKDSFVCNCSSKNCIGVVKGFKYLTANQRIQLKPFLSPFLQTKL